VERRQGKYPKGYGDLSVESIINIFDRLYSLNNWKKSHNTTDCPAVRGKREAESCEHLHIQRNPATGHPVADRGFCVHPSLSFPRSSAFKPGDIIGTLLQLKFEHR
jgi:hypothetical protein